MTDQTTIADLAHKAVATPDTLSHADIVRLGAWVVDHDEHIAAFRRDTAIAPARIERLGEAARTTTQPARSMLPLPEQQTDPQPAQVQQ